MEQGKRVLYLVEWRARGFFDEANSWEKQKDIRTELVNKFGTAYSKCGGNHVGVELLDKRIHHTTKEGLSTSQGGGDVLALTILGRRNQP